MVMPMSETTNGPSCEGPARFLGACPPGHVPKPSVEWFRPNSSLSYRADREDCPAVTVGEVLPGGIKGR